MSASKSDKYNSHLTDAYSRKTAVILHDRVNDIYSETVWITNLELNKAYREYRVVGARNGVTVVEV